MSMLNYVIALGSIVIGLKIIITKEIEQGNASMGDSYLELGNYAYIVGGIFILFGILTLYSLAKKKK